MRGGAEGDRTAHVVLARSLQSVKTLWVLAQRLTTTTSSMYQLYCTNHIYESIFDQCNHSAATPKDQILSPVLEECVPSLGSVGLGTLNRSIHTIILNQRIECPDILRES